VDFLGHGILPGGIATGLIICQITECHRHTALSPHSREHSHRSIFGAHRSEGKFFLPHLLANNFERGI
jgi:hypothetical protein